MSTFMRLLTGAVKSNTVQVNGLLLAIWTALGQSDLIQSNPQYVAIFGGVSALVNLLLRAKTDKPLSER